MEIFKTLILISIVILLIPSCYLLYQIYKGRQKTSYLLKKEQSIVRAKKIAEEQVLDIQKQIDERLKKIEIENIEVEREIEKRNFNLIELEKNLEKKNTLIDSGLEKIKEKKLNIVKYKDDIDKIKNSYIVRLGETANKTISTIEKDIRWEFENEIVKYEKRKIAEAKSSLKVSAEQKAQSILDEIVTTGYIDFFTESTNSKFMVDENEISKIFGKDNEKIKDIEKFSDVEIKIEDTKKEKIKQITVLNIEPIRREVASRIVGNLLENKGNTTVDIKTIIKNEKESLLKEIKLAGDFACKEVNINIPDKLKTILGKGKYRYSYGQNLLKHHMEAAKLAENLAKILKADPTISKLAAFLHDLGKVVTENEDEKPHHHISAELTKEFYESDVLYNAIIAHHYDVDAKYPEAEIVRIVDAISGSRPGARRNNVEDYFEKVKQLQDIAMQHSGVKDAYAINGAREIRIIVNPNEISDKESQNIANKVAFEIEDTMAYPGTIKVNVIREVVEYANIDSSK